MELLIFLPLLSLLTLLRASPPTVYLLLSQQALVPDQEGHLLELRLDMRTKECRHWKWKGIGLYDGGTGFPLSTLELRAIHTGGDIRLYRNRERNWTELCFSHLGQEEM